MKIIIIREKIINKKLQRLETPLNLSFLYDVIELVEEIKTGVDGSWDIKIERMEGCHGN